MLKSTLARAAVVPAAAVALVLTGCAPSGGTAAELGGQRITDAQLTQAAQAIATVEQGADGQDARAAVLGIMLRKDAADRLKAEHGISVTAAEREEALGGQLPPQAQANPTAKSLYEGYADFLVVADKLGAQPTRDEVSRMKPTINPRYGRWDTQKLLVVPTNGAIATQYLPAGQ